MNSVRSTCNGPLATGRLHRVEFDRIAAVGERRNALRLELEQQDALHDLALEVRIIERTRHDAALRDRAIRGDGQLDHQLAIPHVGVFALLPIEYRSQRALVAVENLLDFLDGAAVIDLAVGAGFAD